MNLTGFSKLRGKKTSKTTTAPVSKEPVLRSLKKGSHMSKGKVLQGKICSFLGAVIVLKDDMKKPIFNLFKHDQV